MQYYMDGPGGYRDSRVKGYDGNPVSKKKSEYPYSYDPFLSWVLDDKYIKNPEKHGNCSAVYSDRLLEWDYKKHNRCCKEVWNNEGQYFSNRSPESIERFLRLYNDKPDLKLVKIAEGCNVGNGYPYWIFWYI